MLEELGLDYSLKVYERDPKTIRAPKELADVHPLGKAPVLEVDDVIVAESGAILEYCVEELGGEALRPEPKTAAHRQYRYWMHYAEGTLMPPLLLRLIFDKVRTSPVPFFIKPVIGGVVKKVENSYTRKELELHATFVESHLSKHAFFAGETFSAADIQVSYPIEALMERGRVEASMKHTRAWFEKVTARPAYQRALDKGGAVLLGK